MQKKIIVFASGNGTNVEAICNYFQKKKDIVVAAVFTNNSQAKVLSRIRPFKIKGICFSKEDLKSGKVTALLQDIAPDLIVLAGFLWKIPLKMVNAFPQKIINIHPALLPKYGGQGMYGIHVHKAVKENAEVKTGITIHYVNEFYDEGASIFQKEVRLKPEDKPEQIAKKVHQLEHSYYPMVIETLLNNETFEE